VTESN